MFPAKTSISKMEKLNRYQRFVFEFAYHLVEQTIDELIASLDQTPASEMRIIERYFDRYVLDHDYPLGRS